MYYTTINDENPVLAPVRWLYVVPMALTTTFGLFLLMFKLVYMEEVHIDEEPALAIPNVALEEREPIKDIREAPKKPEDVENPPPKPELHDVENTDVIHGLPPAGYENPVPIAQVGFNFNAPIEHFIVTPRYPGRALSRGIEGFVELRFDVNEMGATSNIEVVRAEPVGVFEDAAIAAAERWKFQPKTENGKAVYFRGLSKLVTFEMQKS